MQVEIILGPPGTGKTTTLLGIVDDELSAGTPAERIGYVSFTKKAAQEAVERAREKFGLSEADLRHFRTLHSTCFHALGMTSGDVFERARVQEFSQWIGIPVTNSVRLDEGGVFGHSVGDRILFMENLARVKKIGVRQLYDQDDDNLDWRMVEYVARAIRQFKRDHNLVDYTDMLSRFVESGWQPEIDVLIVDEGQDLSLLQWDVVWKLASNARRVVIAGDDDQAIYRWAGADVDYFMSLAGSTRVLDQSYRVPMAVQGIASEVARNITHRHAKTWHPRSSEGRIGRPMSLDEIDFRSEPDILVLCRNAYQLQPLTEQLRKDGVIFEWRGNSSARRSTLYAIEAWERLRAGGSISVDDARTVYGLMSSGTAVKRGFKNLPSMKAGDMVTMSDLQDRGGLLTTAIWHEAMDRMTNDERLYILRARQHGESLRKRPRVRLSTIHGAKGGEAEHVVLLTDMAARTHQEMLANPDDEARVWYVAATRARERLSIVAPRTSLRYGL